MIQTVTLIGAGNLATHLGKALNESGFEIKQVYSRTKDAAQKLAKLLGSTATSLIQDIDTTSDLLIISVIDDAIGFIADQLNVNDKLLVHTAGSVSMDILEKTSDNIGVLYPFQTFSKGINVDFRKIPVCIEANNKESFEQLKQLSEKISDKVLAVGSEQRSVIHIAAVFSCNFVNHLYTLSDQLLQDSNLSMDLLYPLVQETTEKLMKINPKEAQTGPALRGDKEIINKHLESLKDMPEMKKIYQMLSESIYKLHHQ